MKINGLEDYVVTHVHVENGTITVTYEKPGKKRVRNRDNNGRYSNKSLREKVKAIHDTK